MKRFIKVRIGLVLMLLGGARIADQEGQAQVSNSTDSRAQVAPTAADINILIEALAKYQSGESMQPLRRIEQLIREASSNAGLRNTLESGLVKLLSIPSTPEAKQFASQQLGTIGTEESLPALAKLLTSPGTVALGCQALSTHPSPQANEILRTALRELRGETRSQIISTLGDRQDKESVGQIARLVSDADNSVAAAAIMALGKIATPPALEALEAARKTAHAAVAAALREASLTAAEKLAGSGDTQAAGRIYEGLLEPGQPDNVRRGAFEALLQLDADGGEQRILDTLRGPDTLLKPVAIAGARALQSASASEKLVASLPHLAPSEQVWLIQTLASRRDAVAQAAVEAGLKSSDRAVRLGSIDALSKMGDAAAVGPLAQALARASTAPEKNAIERALSGLRGGEEVGSTLVTALTGSPEGVQVSLIRILARRDTRTAFPALLAAADKPGTAEIAWQSLASLARAEDVPVLLDKLLRLEVPSARSEAEGAVAQALAKTPEPAQRSRAVLAHLSQSPDPAARGSLLRLLPSCGDLDALHALQTAGTDPRPGVRDTVIRTLAEWPDMRAWDALLDALQHAESNAHRAVSLNALVRLAQDQNSAPDATQIKRYRDLLGTVRNDDERKQVLSALAGAPLPEALGLVLPLLSNPAIQAEAALAVRSIAAAIQKEHSEAAAEALRQLQ